MLILIGGVGIAYSDPPIPFQVEVDRDPLDIWNDYPTILDGTIIQKSQSDQTTSFDIKINELFKGTTNAKLVTAHIAKENDWILSKGDRALIYLGQGNEISIYSVKTSKVCNARDLIQISPVLPNDYTIVRGAPVLPWEWKDLCVPNYFTYDPDFWQSRPYYPPVKQYSDHHLLIKMQKCSSEEYVPIIPKTHSYHIACVKQESASKLIERGWAECLWNCSGPIPIELTNDSIHSEPENFAKTLQGNDAQAICSALRIPCPSNPIFSHVTLTNDEYFLTYTTPEDFFEIKLNQTHVCLKSEKFQTTRCDER